MTTKQITCETQGHLWSRGDYGDVCIMCKTPKPQDSPTSNERISPYDVVENAIAAYQGDDCELARRIVDALTAEDLLSPEPSGCAECGVTKDQHDNPDEFVPRAAQPPRARKDHDHLHTCETESECAACDIEYWQAETEKLQKLVTAYVNSSDAGIPKYIRSNLDEMRKVAREFDRLPETKPAARCPDCGHDRPQDCLHEPGWKPDEKPATNGGMKPTCPNCGHEPCAEWCSGETPGAP